MCKRGYESLFDFDRDGELDIAEEALVYDFIMEEEEAEESESWDDDDC